MTFDDIFKSSFLENVTSVSILDMVLALVLASGLGLFIFFVYKKTYQGVMYSSSFGVTLIALTMITTVVILAVTSNVVLSLGMVLDFTGFCQQKEQLQPLHSRTAMRRPRSGTAYKAIPDGTDTALRGQKQIGPARGCRIESGNPS